MASLRDLIGDRAAGELVEELGVLYEQVKVLGWREVRPWGEFFGGFKVPAELTAKHVEERVTTNFLHYRSNYAIVCSVLLLLQVFLSPMLLLAVPLALVFCVYLLIVHKRPIKIGDIKISDSQKQTICAIFCLFFFAITGVLERLVWIIIYWVFTVGLHMIMRPRNMSSKANKVYEEMKLNGYTDIFSMFSKSTTPTTASAMDYDKHDPENPVVRENEIAGSPTPYGFSSNLGSSHTTVDMRKRGPNNSSGTSGLSYTAAPSSSSKKD